MDVTPNNAWVNSYLEALLSSGLSAEHLQSNNGTAPRFASGDDEQATVAAYYVHQILSLDEDRIREAWAKAQSSARAGPSAPDRDARIEYLSWRVWAMKRRRAEVEMAVAAHRRETADEEMDEIDATTLMTIDDLNSTAMAEFEELGLFDSGAHDASSTASESNYPSVTRQEAADDSAGIKAPDSAALLMPPPALRLPSLAAGQKTPPQGHARTPAAGAGSALASPFASVPPSPAIQSRRPSNADLFRHPWGPNGQPPVSPGANVAGAGFAQSAPDPLLTSRFPRLYIILISLHGLVRGEKMELGKDPDTGGQVKYVVELAKALGRFPSVARVDLLTRLIADPKVDSSYSVPEERLVLSGQQGEANGSTTPSETSDSARGAFIVRLPCGPANVYLRKEDLWPHVREFADRAISHASRTLARLQENGPCELYVVHGHYADAGEAAGLISSTLGVDCVLTGHSLGRNKKEHLLKSGTMSPAEVESTYRISRRIEGEERALDHAAVVFTSTQQEVEQQWGTYDGYSDQLSAALQLRPCKGYHVPRMAVIPPGLDFSNLKVQMPVDPWEEVLGTSGGKTSPAQPATPTASGPLPTSNASQAGSSVVAPATPPPLDITTGTEASFDLPPASAGAEETHSTSSGGTAGRGVKETRSVDMPTDQSSPARVFKRASVPGDAMTPTSGGAASALSSMNPARMAALMVGESEPGIWKEINRFLRYPGRPVILAMARPDAKKNLIGLLKAYGDSRLLRDLANLVLVMGNRDKIDAMAPGSTRVLTDVLKLVDTYDLYGYVAYPKKHAQADISDIYLLAAATRGVFVNVALQEPFGLTLIEAAAHGVPIVATTHGGPVDIVATLKNGLLVEPTDTRAIADACVSLITAQRKWDQCSESGRRNITAYSWPSHCARYLRTVEDQKNNSANSKTVTLYNANPINPPDPHSQHKVPAPAIKIRHTLSLSYDDLSSLARAIAFNTPTSSAAIINDAVAVVAAAAAAGGAQQKPAATSPKVSEGGASTAAEPEASNPTDTTPAADALARTSAPLFTDLRSTFSMPLSQAFVSSLQRRSQRGSTKQQGVLNIPAPADIAMAIAEETYEKTPVEESEEATATTHTDSASTAAEGAVHASQPDVKESTQVVEDKAQEEAMVKDTTSAAVKGAVAAVAHDAADQVEEWGGNQAVQKVLAAAIDALEETSGGGGRVRRCDDLSAAGLVARSGSLTAAEGNLRPTLSFKAAQMTAAKELQPRMYTHEQFVVFNFDSVADVKTCGPLIRTLLQGVGSASEDPAVTRQLQLLTRGGSASVQGVGVMCTWGTKDLRTLLTTQGIDPLQLDFMVCNAGALIWHSTVQEQPASPDKGAPGSSSLRNSGEHADAAADPRPVGRTASGAGDNNNSSSGSGSLLCDDEWEHYIDWRWDDRVVKQVLGRVLDNKAGWGRLNIIRTGPALPSGSRKGKATAASQTGGAVLPNAVSVAVGLSPASSPLHFMLDVEVLSSGKDSVSDIAKLLLATVRRKLRKSGLRVQLVATPQEPLPSDSTMGLDSARSARSGTAGGALSALLNSIAATLSRGTNVTPGQAGPGKGDSLRSFVLHITPLRCNRALALRHLALRSRRSLEGHWTVVACPASGSITPTATATKGGQSTTHSVSGSLISMAPSPSLAHTVPPVLLCGSDGEDLVSGVQRVVVLEANKEVKTNLPAGGSTEPWAAGVASVAFPVDVGMYSPVLVEKGAGRDGHEQAAEALREAELASDVRLVLVQ